MNSSAEQHLISLAQWPTMPAFNICRRRQVLAYFGESYEHENCGACDICADHVERVDATREAQMIMSAIARTQERFGAVHIISLVRGERTKKIVELEHDALKTFGVGKDRESAFGILSSPS